MIENIFLTSIVLFIIGTIFAKLSISLPKDSGELDMLIGWLVLIGFVGMILSSFAWIWMR